MYGAAARRELRAGALSIKTLVMPEWWLLAPLPVCFALLAIEFVFRMRRLARADAGRATTRCRRHEGAACRLGRRRWLLLGGSTVLLFLGLPVAFSFLAINLLGAWLLLGGERRASRSSRATASAR